MRRFVFGLSIVAACLAVPVQAQVTYATDGTTAIIPGLTGFATTGADMTGLNVTATFSNGFCGSCVATATYGGLTSIGLAAAVGDLFQKVTVDFTGGTGPRTDWSFVQDTDNDSRFVPGIPEPETYALLLGGLGLVSWVAKRRRRVA